MNKLEKTIRLTTKKDRQIVLTLNYDLVRLIKEAAQKNNIKITQLVKTWMINYLDENGYLGN